MLFTAERYNDIWKHTTCSLANIYVWCKHCGRSHNLGTHNYFDELVDKLIRRGEILITPAGSVVCNNGSCPSLLSPEEDERASGIGEPDLSYTPIEGYGVRSSPSRTKLGTTAYRHKCKKE